MFSPKKTNLLSACWHPKSSFSASLLLLFRLQMILVWRLVSVQQATPAESKKRADFLASVAPFRLDGAPLFADQPILPPTPTAL